MGECYPSFEEFTGSQQSVAHVAKEEELVGRDAIGMCRDAAIADVYFPIRNELAQMVVGPAVAEPKLEHVPVQLPNEVGR